MNALMRIGLGTVQFGEDYGISNRQRKPDEQEVANILAHAVEAGVKVIDTATVYGDAELLLGKHLPLHHAMRIVTKIPAVVGDRIEPWHAKHLLDSLAASLDRLRVDCVHALLVHQASDLGKTGWPHLINALYEAQSRGWTRRIGASVYGIEQLSLVESRFRPEIVQLPLNVLDRRLLAAGWLEYLHGRGTEIHARSIFLQGALLMHGAELPPFLMPIADHIDRLSILATCNGISRTAACLAFVLQQPAVNFAIVGVNRRTELKEIEAAVALLDGQFIDFGPAPSVDALCLDPSAWRAFRQ